MSSKKDDAGMMARALSYLIAVVSIVSAVAGLVAFSLDYGDWLGQKMRDIISGISLPLSAPVERRLEEPVDCNAITVTSERIFCINKQKEREDCAKTNCQVPFRGQAAKA
jgi:hypothetical protein